MIVRNYRRITAFARKFIFSYSAISNYSYQELITNENTESTLKRCFRYTKNFE